MTKLSPDAQWVRDSLPDDLDHEDNDIVAAKVIRAVVDRVIPERMIRELGDIRAECDIRAEFLAIAEELENCE